MGLSSRTWPHNAAGLDDGAHDIATQASAAWEAAVCWDLARRETFAAPHRLFVGSLFRIDA